MSVSSLFEKNNYAIHADEVVFTNPSNSQIIGVFGDADASYNLTLPPSGPTEDAALTVDASGQLSFSTSGGGSTVFHHYNIDGLLGGASKPADNTLYGLTGPTSLTPDIELPNGAYLLAVRYYIKKIGTGANSHTVRINLSGVGSLQPLYIGGSLIVHDVVGFNVSVNSEFWSKWTYLYFSVDSPLTEGILNYFADTSMGTTYDDYRVLAFEIKVVKTEHPVVDQIV